MEKLKRIFLLVPLLLLVAVTSAWAGDVVLIPWHTVGSESHSNYIGGEVTIPGSAFDNVDVSSNDEIIISRDGTSTCRIYWSYNDGTRDIRLSDESDGYGKNITGGGSISYTINDATILSHLKARGLKISGAGSDADKTFHITVKLRLKSSAVKPCPSGYTSTIVMNNQSFGKNESDYGTGTNLESFPRGYSAGDVIVVQYVEGQEAHNILIKTESNVDLTDNSGVSHNLTVGAYKAVVLDESKAATLNSSKLRIVGYGNAGGETSFKANVIVYKQANEGTILKGVRLGGSATAEGWGAWQYIHKNFFSNITANDEIVVRVTDFGTNDHITLQMDMGNVKVQYPTIYKGTDEEYVVRLNEVGGGTYDGEVMANYLKGSYGTSLDGNGGFFGFQGSGTEFYVDIIVRKHGNASNSNWILPNTGSVNSPGSLLDSGSNYLRFETELFDNRLIDGIYGEQSNPGMSFEYTTAESFGLTSYPNLSFRIGKVEAGQWVTKYDITNSADYFLDASFRMNDHLIWIQFSNDMLNALRNDGCELRIYGQSNVTIKDARFDFTGDDPNGSRSWNYVNGIYTWYAAADNNSTTSTEDVNLWNDGLTTLQTKQLYPVVKTAQSGDATFGRIHYKSSDESIASVNQSGLVTLKAAGTVTITAEPWDNRLITPATYTLNVNDNKYTIRYVASIPNPTDTDAKDRMYAMKKPDGTDTSTPVIISLHGRGNDYNSGRPDFDSYAGSAIIIYPRGERLTIFDGLRGWESTGNNSDRALYNRDIEFFKNILADLGAQGIRYNTKKVYIAGFSNGGMMAYQAASQAGDVFAAAASVSGIPVNEFRHHHTGVRPVPFLHIHGTNDGVIPLHKNAPNYVSTQTDKGDGTYRGPYGERENEDDADSYYDFYMIDRVIDDMIHRNGAQLTTTPVTTGKITKYKYQKSVDDGADFYYYQVTDMIHWPSSDWTGDGVDDVAPEMWNFFFEEGRDRTLPDAGSYSDLKFLADWRTVGDSYNKGCHGFYLPSGERTLLWHSSEGYIRNEGYWDSSANKYVTTSYGNHNVYRSIQFETRDNNGDGVVQGLHRMRLVINGNTRNSYITIRLKRANEGDVAPTFYKRFVAYTGGVDREIKLNFNAEQGFHEYELWIEKTGADDATTVKLIEFRSGSYAKSDLTEEAVYTPAQLTALNEMNLVRQPKYSLGAAVAKSYFAFSGFEAKYSADATTYNRGDRNLTGTYGSTVKETEGFSGIYLSSITKLGENEFVSGDDEERSIAFLTGGNDYNVDAAGVRFAQNGRAGMPAYLEALRDNSATASSLFPSRGTFVMKVAGTLDVTMLCKNKENTTHTVNVYYMNDRSEDVPQFLATYRIEGKVEKIGDVDTPLPTEHGEGWNDPDGAPIIASLRLEHMGKDGTCTLFFTYEGSQEYNTATGEYAGADSDISASGNPQSSNDFWVKGFIIKRPDLSVTIGRTDNAYRFAVNADGDPVDTSIYDMLPSNIFDEGDDLTEQNRKKRAWVYSMNSNAGTSAYGMKNETEGKPYRWLFKAAGFDREETFNEKDDRTYLCGYVIRDNGEVTSTKLNDHLLIYSENAYSNAHFIGTDGDEHLQFDSPTHFRYNTYQKLSDGTIEGLIYDINSNEGGSVFDPIVNDGLKVNVTGSGWFKVRAKVPTGQHNVKMTIMTSVNGGNEHIKLLRYFKLPNDGMYHDYVAYLKASAAIGKTFSTLEAERFNAEREQQSLFVVFEDISSDIKTTVPGEVLAGAGIWNGDNNGFQVNIEEMSWLNDNVPDYVFQREQYLFRSQTDNDEVAGHINHAYLRRRQQYPASAEREDVVLYWQAGGADAAAYRIKDGKVYANEDCTTEVKDNALEAGGFAYDTNWQLVSGGTNPKYGEGGVYTKFGLTPDAGRSVAHDFGGYWDMAAMPALGLNEFVTYGKGTHGINVDGVYTGAKCTLPEHNHNGKGPESPLWKGAHTEMQSPRISVADGTAFTWNTSTEFRPCTKTGKVFNADDPVTTNTEFDLPISGPFFRFMPMKNATITAYVVPGNTEGVIYVLDETGKIVKNNTAGTLDWKISGSVDIENATITNGIIKPATGRNVGDVERAKTVKVTISARAGKEYFLASSGMAIGVATMYFDEITSIDKRAEVELKEGTAGGSAVNGSIKTALEDGGSKYTSLKFNRKLTAGKWAAVVLPVSLNEEKFKDVFGETAQAMHFETVDANGKIHLLHHRYKMVVAGRPIFIKPSEDVASGTVIDDVTLQAYDVTEYTGKDNKGVPCTYEFTGSMEPESGIREYSIFMATKNTKPGDDDYHVSHDGTLTRYTQSKMSLPAGRSWIRYKGEEGLAPKFITFGTCNYNEFEEDDSETTAIEDLLEDMGVTVVRKDNKVYDLNGRVVATGADVNSLPSGIYIVNGKKFVK